MSVCSHIQPAKRIDWLKLAGVAVASPSFWRSECWPDLIAENSHRPSAARRYVGSMSPVDIEVKLNKATAHLNLAVNAASPRKYTRAARNSWNCSTRQYAATSPWMWACGLN